MATIKWLRSKGKVFGQYCVADAAGRGHLEAIKEMRRSKARGTGESARARWSEAAVEQAAKGGHLEVVQWLRQNGCPWNSTTCYLAAKGGHLDVFKWLRDQDPPCPWNEGTCTDAAWGGHRNVLEWLRDQDPPCPLDIGECAGAAWELISDGMTGRGDDILQWIEELEENESDEEFYDSDEEY